MLRLALIWLGVVVVLLGIFLLTGVMDPEFLRNPQDWLREGGLWAMAGSLGLLAADVVLPVPSSMLMMGNGMVFGVMAGTALNLLGGIAATVVAFALGRWAEPWLHKWMSEEEREHANRLLGKWGWLAILVSRPIPLLAESLALIAGASTMRWRVMIVAAAVGALPGAWGYAAAGAAAGGVQNPVIITGIVVGISVVLWFFARLIQKRTAVPAEVIDG